MHYLHRTIAVFVLVVYSISSVQCQGSLQNELRTNLTRMLQYVVHPSAQASAQIIDYAVQMGGRPKTIMERLGYLNFIKDIARTVPEFMAQFTSTQTRPDGSTVQQIDENRFEDVIVTRASDYSNRNNKQDTGVAAGSSGVQATGVGTGSGTFAASGTGSVPTANTGSGAVTGIGTNTLTSGSQNTGSQPNMMVGASQVPQTNTVPADAFSFLDLFAVMDQNNQNLMLF